MDNGTSGFSLLEVLVSILVLGFVVGFTVLFFSRIYAKPISILRGEAIRLAETELINAFNTKAMGDTLYANAAGNLIILRKAMPAENIIEPEILVIAKATGDTLVNLRTAYAK